MIRTLRMMGYALVFAGFVYTSLTAYAWWKAHSAERDAMILLSEVRKLTPGEATTADVESLARNHSSFFVKGSPSRSLNALYYDFLYDNWLLWKLRVMPRVVFSIRLQVVDRRLDVIMVDIDSGLFPRPRYSATVFDFQQADYPGDPGYNLVRRNHWISIRLKPTATPDQRKQAYSFNLKCLDRIGGCYDEKELLPGPWQTSK
jgi:hypothetical protein